MALTISEETSVSMLVIPSSSTVAATRRAARLIGGFCSPAGRSRSVTYMRSAQRRGELGHDALLLCRGDLRVQRERQDLAGRLLGVREAAGTVAEVREGRGQVDRDRVVQPGADAGRVQVGEGGVTALGRDAHHV